MIGIFSPVHRSGKTGYGLRLGQELAVSRNVLYLNMEIYGGIGGHFPEEGHTLGDVLYYLRQGIWVSYLRRWRSIWGHWITCFR